MSRSVTVWPTGASAWSLDAAVPRATSTALPAGMPTRALETVLVTVASMSTFGADGGNSESTAATEPSTRGVMRPQSDVKSDDRVLPRRLVEHGERPPLRRSRATSR